MHPQSPRDVGSMLRTLRENARFTQDALARASRCSKPYLSLVESGQRTLSIERASAIEAALGIHDGRLQAALNWQRVPEAIRAEIERSQSRSADMTRRLRSALGGKDPLASLRAMIDRVEDDDDVPLPPSSRHRSATSIAHAESVWRGVSADGALPRGRPIPIINKVAAGSPREFTDLDYPRAIADDYLACPPPGVSDPDAFAARVTGDSMEPEYFDGDVVVFSPEAKIAPPPGAGVDCFVRFERDGESTFKRAYFDEAAVGKTGGAAEGTKGGAGGVKRKKGAGAGTAGGAERGAGGRAGTIRLQPLNSAYPPRIVSREEVAGLYAAVYVLRKVKRAGMKQ